MQRAWRLMLALKVESLQNQQFHIEQMSTSQGLISALRFSRPSFRRSAPVVLINGYAALGYKDPRMRAVAGAISAAGFDVWFPVLPPVEALSLSTDAIDSIEQAIEAVYHHTGQPVSVFAPSIGGGLSFIACTKLPEGMIRAFCGIGMYGHLQTCVDHVIQRETENVYGSLIIMMNYVERVIGPNQAVVKGLRIAIDDDVQEDALQLPEYLQSLDKKDATLLSRMLNEQRFRIFMCDEIQRQLRQTPSFYSSMNPMGRLDQVHWDTHLVHGSSDNVIPPEESIMLNHSLKDLKKHSNLLLTPLLSHADLGFRFSMLKEVWQMGSFFAAFIKSAEKPLQSTEKTELWLSH